MTPGSAIGIVLAAGASSRMGKIKALMPVSNQDEPAVRYLARQMLTVCTECIVVTGFHAEQVHAAVQGMACVRVAHNAEPQRGQLSSLQTGIAALRQSGAAWVLFAPVDCMAIDRQVMESLRREMDASGLDVALCVPSHRGRHGHPVAFRSAYTANFLELGPDDSARTVVHALRSQTRYVEMPTEDFLLDVDRPEDYARLLARRSKEDLPSE